MSGLKAGDEVQDTAGLRFGDRHCEADWDSDYFGGCRASSRYRLERPGDGYSPVEACPAHLADMIAYLADGDDVPVTVQVRWDNADAARSFTPEEG